MLDFGWAELLIIVAVAVFVIGPKDIPKMMYSMGRVLRRFQYVRFAVTKQFDDLMQAGDLEELRKGVSNSVNFEENRRALNEEELKPQEDIDTEYDEAEFDEAEEHLEATNLEVLYEDISQQYSEAFNMTSDYIDEFLNHVPSSGYILDAGCGVGVDAAYMNSKEYSVLAIDCHGSMLQIAKKNYPEVRFKNQNIKNLGMAANSFDGILAAYSLIHFDKSDIKNVIDSFHHVLKTGGVLYISVHGGEPDEIIIPEPFNHDLNVFLNIMSTEEITNILIKCGFEVLNSYERDTENEEEFDYKKLCLIARKLGEVKND